MTELTIIKGDDRAREFLESGATLADFLTDPFRPCVAYVLGNPEQILAVNRGSYGVDQFVSGVWEQSAANRCRSFIIEYMASPEIILRAKRSDFTPPKNMQKFLEQNCACELSCQNNTDELIKELQQRGFRMAEFSLKDWAEPLAQREAKISQMAAEIALFYGK